MRSLSELDAVLDTLVDGVIMIDDVGSIQRYNPACERIFGYSKEDVIGENVSLLMPEPDRSNHDSYISNYQQNGDAKVIGIGREVKGRRKNGQIFPMYLSVGEMPRDGKPAFVGIIRDMSIEVQRRESFNNLQQEHFHLSRLAAMDQLGTAIAHELNQPLTAVMNYLEAASIVLQKTDAPKPEKLEDILRSSQLQTERASKILSRLRSFIATGKTEMAEVDITKLLDTSLALVMPTYKNSGISINFNIPKPLPFVRVNDVQIQQVLVNLLKNACEAMMDEEQKVLTIFIHKSINPEIKITIEDTGKGMSDTQFSQLFEPFSSTKKNGLGVGLSICKTIIMAHDGEIWAERKDSKGCRFHITLPIYS